MNVALCDFIWFSFLDRYSTISSLSYREEILEKSIFKKVNALGVELATTRYTWNVNFLTIESFLRNNSFVIQITLAFSLSFYHQASGSFAINEQLV